MHYLLKQKNPKIQNGDLKLTYPLVIVKKKKKKHSLLQKEGHRTVHRKPLTTVECP